MQSKESKTNKAALMSTLSAGALWGIFESTAGYVLHLLPVSFGFLIWYPVACFFLAKSYRDSGKPRAVVMTAALAAVVKLLNLLLPGRIDRVINPAASIVFEGLAIFAAVCVYRRVSEAAREKPWVWAVLSLGANSLWRLMYVGYLVFIVPEWMREVSVIRSAEAISRFIIIDNLAGSCVALLGFLILSRLRRRRTPTAKNTPGLLKAGWLGAFLLLALDIGLQFLS